MRTGVYAGSIVPARAPHSGARSMTSVRTRLAKLEQNVQYRLDAVDIPRQRDAQEAVNENPDIRLVRPEDTDPLTFALIARTVSDADGDLELADQIRDARPPWPGMDALKSATTLEERRRVMGTIGGSIAEKAMTWEQDVDDAVARARERLGLPWQPPARRERRDGRGGDEWDAPRLSNRHPDINPSGTPC
jgi:hypothetical protein